MRKPIFTPVLRKFMHAVLDHLMDAADAGGYETLDNINLCITEHYEFRPTPKTFVLGKFEGDINQDNSAPMWDVEVWNTGMTWNDDVGYEIDRWDTSETVLAAIPNLQLIPNWDTNDYDDLKKGD